MTSSKDADMWIIFDDDQVAEEELEQEVNNAIEEFKRYDQEYDEARVREQVITSQCTHKLRSSRYIGRDSPHTVFFRTDAYGSTWSVLSVISVKKLIWFDICVGFGQAQELLEGSKVLEWLTEHADITYVPKSS